MVREEKGEGGDRGDLVESPKRERAVKPVISSLSVFHSPEHPERFTELSREEKGEGGDRGDLGEKKCQKGREQSSQ